MKAFGLPVFAALVVAGGCVSVLPKANPAAPRYLIAPVAYDAPSTETFDWTLSIDDPQATHVYDNVKIALTREPGRVEFYANGEWADRAPRLFQTALVRSFENTGRILGVGDRVAQPISDFGLQTDIRMIEAANANGQVTAKFAVYARLTNARGRVIAGRLFEASAKAGADAAPDVARAIDEAVGAALREIVDWSIAEAGKAHASKAESGSRKPAT